MQQLSLLPSSGAQQADSQTVSRGKHNDVSPRFKQAYGDAESALKNGQASDTASTKSRRSELAIQEGSFVGKETGKDLPENSEGLPADNGKALPRQVSTQVSERSFNASSGDSSAIPASGDRGFGPSDAASAGLLANAISALSAANGSGVDIAQGHGAGVSILGTAQSLATTPADGMLGGLPNLAQKNGLETSLHTASTELVATQPGASVVASGVAQNQAKAGFQFEINGSSQMSESANAKLAELAAAGGNSVSGASGNSGKLASGVAPESLLQSTVLGAAIKEGERGLSSQAANANGSALSGVNSNALAYANEQAQFNKMAGSELSTQAASAADPVNGLQAESELRFKAAMESVQSGRLADAADSVDVNAIKLDASVQSGKGAELKAAESQTQNVARPYVSSLGIPVDDAEWSNQLGQKLMWMSARNIQSAELHLNPADLGPIDVRIQVGSDQSSISFNTQNQGVRELLEANIHRLREMLNNPAQADSDQSGGTLAQDSGAQSQSESQAQTNGESLADQPGANVSAESDQSEHSSASRSVPADDRLVDAYV